MRKYEGKQVYKYSFVEQQPTFIPQINTSGSAGSIDKAAVVFNLATRTEQSTDNTDMTTDGTGPKLIRIYY